MINLSALLRKFSLPLLFISAFIIRLIHLNQSLWLDEATTAVTVQKYDWFEIITRFSPTDFHPPLYYLFMKLWTNFFGYSEIALRLPSVFFSLGTGWVIYKIGRVLSGSRNGVQNDTLAFWATAFFLFNPLIIYYSQEARMYSMVTLTISISFYYLIKIINYQLSITNLFKNRDFWLMNFFLILSFYTFYASIFYIATAYLFMFISSSGLTQGSRFKIIFGFPRVLWGMTRKVALYSFLAFIFSLIVISPLLLKQYANSREALSIVTNWSSVLGNVSLKNLALIPIKFTSGRISFEPKMIYYLLAGGWMMFVGFVIAIVVILNSLASLASRSGIQDPDRKGFRKKIGMILVFLLMPLIFGTIFSFVSPLLQYFRFQYLILFLSLLLALTVCSFDTLFAHAVTLKACLPARQGPTALIRKKMSSLTLARMIGFFILFGFVSWSLLYLLSPQFHREDWKSLTQELHDEEAPVYMILSSSDPLKYYAPKLDIQSLKTIDMQKSGGDIVIIPYTVEIHGVDYKKILEGNGYTKSKTYIVHGLSYERWSFEALTH